MKVLLTATVQSHICQFHKPLADLLHSHGWEVHAAARNNLHEKNGLALDFADRVFDVPFQRSPLSRQNVQAYQQLRQIIAAGQYDVIHCNTPVGGVITRLAARNARKQGTRVIYTAHGFHFYQGAPRKNWLVYYPVERWMARYTDTLVTITEEDYRLAAERFACPAAHIHGVGIKTEKFDAVSPEQALAFRRARGWDERPLILCTGELNENKNQRTLLLAMPKLLERIPNALLLLAGNGPAEEALHRQIEEMGLEQSVELLGYRTDLEWFVHACDLVVSASFREGLPLNIMEAMYCGKAVVASENRGHRELVQPGRTGYLVPAADAEGFAETIAALLLDDRKRGQLAEAGRMRSARYTDKAVQQELSCLYALGGR